MCFRRVQGSSSCSLPDPETGLNSLENVWVETPCSGLEYHRHHDDQAYKREKLSPAVHSVSGGGGGGGLRGRNDNTNDGSSADDRCYRCVPATTFGGGSGGSFFASGGDGDGDDDGFNGNGKGHELRTIGRGRGGPGSDEPLVGRGRLRRSRDRRRRRPREHSGESEEDEDRGIAGTRLAEAEEAGSVKRGGGGGGAGEALAAGVVAALLSGVAAAAAAAAVKVGDERDEGGSAVGTTISSLLSPVYGGTTGRVGRRGAVGGRGGGLGGITSGEDTSAVDSGRPEANHGGRGDGREPEGATGTAPDAAASGKLYKMSPEWRDSRVGLARSLQVMSPTPKNPIFLRVVGESGGGGGDETRRRTPL